MTPTIYRTEDGEPKDAFVPLPLSQPERIFLLSQLVELVAEVERAYSAYSARGVGDPDDVDRARRALSDTFIVLGGTVDAVGNVRLFDLVSAGTGDRIGQFATVIDLLETRRRELPNRVVADAHAIGLVQKLHAAAVRAQTALDDARAAHAKEA